MTGTLAESLPSKPPGESRRESRKDRAEAGLRDSNPPIGKTGESRTFGIAQRIAQKRSSPTRGLRAQAGIPRLGAGDCPALARPGRATRQGMGNRAPGLSYQGAATPYRPPASGIGVLGGRQALTSGGLTP